MAERYPIAREEDKRICLERESVSVPRYATFHTSIVATGEQGSDPGELWFPCGVAIHEDTHQVFIVNRNNHRVEIFTETGEFLIQLGVGQLSSPWGIAIHGDVLYVSCSDHTLNKFSLNEMRSVRMIGGYGSNHGQFHFPSYFTTDPIGRVFIADTCNDRICIYDPDLNHLRNITHESMLLPYDVKVSRDLLYVLCPRKNPCMLVLTLEGDKLHFLITCGEGMEMIRPIFFCLDSLNNFIISDYQSHSTCVFSPEGSINLLAHLSSCNSKQVYQKGHQPGMFYRSIG